MKRMFTSATLTLSLACAGCFLLCGTLSAQRKGATQPIRAEIYRLERQDSVMYLDMNIDLTGVHMAPDCTVYLFPVLGAGSDSLQLPPVMLNGPQSDRMYRRRRALGRTTGMEKILPYVVLRENEHRLPRLNYRTQVPFQSWMTQADVTISDAHCNCDARLVPFAMQVEHIPPVIVKEFVTVRDTLYLTKNVSMPTYVPAPVKAEPQIEQVKAGYEADIYFPTGKMVILPDHELNRYAWMQFVNQVDSIQYNSANTVSGVYVTGYSSPEGSVPANDRLAEKRAQALQQFLENKYGGQMEVRADWISEDWERLAEMVDASDLPDKAAILAIVRNDALGEGRKQALKKLEGGHTFDYLLQEYFPKLRRVSCRIGYIKKIER